MTGLPQLMLMSVYANNDHGGGLSVAGLKREFSSSMLIRICQHCSSVLLTDSKSNPANL